MLFRTFPPVGSHMPWNDGESQQRRRQAPSDEKLVTTRCSIRIITGFCFECNRISNKQTTSHCRVARTPMTDLPAFALLRLSGVNADDPQTQPDPTSNSFTRPLHVVLMIQSQQWDLLHPRVSAPTISHCRRIIRSALIAKGHTSNMNVTIASIL